MKPLEQTCQHFRVRRIDIKDTAYGYCMFCETIIPEQDFKERYEEFLPLIYILKENYMED